jgi:hypothetical protein
MSLSQKLLQPEDMIQMKKKKKEFKIRNCHGPYKDFKLHN